MKKVLLSSMVVACCLLSDLLQAKTHWVTDSKELSRALGRAIAGDEVILSPGEYNLSRFSSRRGGTELAPITVKAVLPGAAIIHAQRAETFSIYHPYWIFENLVIKGTNKTQHAFHLSRNADHVIIRNNKLFNFHSHIKSNGSRGQFPDAVLIEGNHISNESVRNTSAPTSPIDVVGGSNWMVRNNYVADFSRTKGLSISYGIFLKGNSSNGMIEQNLVICSRNHQGGYRLGISLGGGGSDKAHCANQDCQFEHRSGTIRNNIVLNCSDAGIYLKKAIDSYIYNNTLINTLGIDVQLPESSAVIENNYVGGVILARKGATIEEQSNVTTSWGVLPYAETAVKRVNLWLAKFHLEQPLILNEKNLGRIQDMLEWFGKWVADSRLGLGRDKGLEDFNGVFNGDLTPTVEGILITSNRISSVKRDFWGNVRSNKNYIGAIDLSVSSSDITKKMKNL